jgi:hypothetical protein
MLFSKCAFALALAVAMFADSTLPAPGNLTVHEWGTFTSVAGPEGNPIAWLPLSGPGDLPCFVHHLSRRTQNSPCSAWSAWRLR